jgi:hypothetical protein
VGSHLQILNGVAAVLARGESYSRENALDLDELVRFRLRDDMAPFSFQVISVWHHSMGAMKGMQAGVFAPPPKMSGMSYESLKDLVAEAIAFEESLPRDEVEALSGRDVVFRMGGNEIPFTTDGFLASFSLPNFYFHATTTYTVLRMHGVPLGKMDFLGQLRLSANTSSAG